MRQITLPIFYHHELFADGVSRLLRPWAFDPVLIDARQEGALEQLRQMRPRLILVEANCDVDFAETIGQILSDSPTVGVIRLSLDSNQLSLYSARQVMAYGSEDLVAAFRQLESSSSEQEGQTAEPALVE